MSHDNKIAKMGYKRKRSGTTYGRAPKRGRAKATVRRGRRRYTPSRLYGRKTYDRTQRIVNKTLRSISENKFKGYAPLQCIPPTAKPGGTQPISYHFFNTGKDLSAILPEFPAFNGAIASQGEMNLFEFSQGDSKSERIGSSMYVRGSHIKMEIQMSHKSDIAQPGNPTVSFRLMIVKAKRALDKYGEAPDPGSTLFLTPQNNSFGYDATVQDTFQYMQQPINKREWAVYKDMRFTLSAPYQQQAELGVPAQAFVNAKYPTKKVLNCKLPVGKKCNFGTDDTPTNLDTQWFIILQAVNTNYCEDSAAPRNYFVNMVGTTTALDN